MSNFENDYIHILEKIFYLKRRIAVIFFLREFIITWIHGHVSDERYDAPKFQRAQWSRDKYVHLYPEYEREFERFDVHLLANGSPSFTSEHDEGGEPFRAAAERFYLGLEARVISSPVNNSPRRREKEKRQRILFLFPSLPPSSLGDPRQINRIPRIFLKL